MLCKHLQQCFKKPLGFGDSERALNPKPDVEDAGHDEKGVEILSCLEHFLLDFAP